MDSVYLLSEPGAEEAVDDEVGGGVDDEEDVGDEAEEDYPDGKTSKDSATTDLDLLQEFFIKWIGRDGKLLPEGWRAHVG